MIGRPLGLIAICSSAPSLRGNKVRVVVDQQHRHVRRRRLHEPARGLLLPEIMRRGSKASKTQQPSSQGEQLRNVARTFRPTLIKTERLRNLGSVYREAAQEGAQFGRFF